MKAKFYLTFIVANFLVSSVVYSQFDRSGLAPAIQPISSRNAPATATDDWFNNASAWIKSFEYDFHPDGTNAYKTTNPASKVAYHIRPDGYTAYPMRAEEAEPDWTVMFNLRSAGRDKPSFTFTTPVSTEKGDLLIQHFGFADVEYLNNDKGLRQNFIIYENPGGKGHLRIQMSLQTQLSAKVEDRQSLVFTDASEKKRLIYQDLKVWDANHKELDAYMALDKNGRILSIVVDDAHASYPVTIDPLNKAPDWTTSAEGILPTLLGSLPLQVQALYGYNVTGLGDINADGFADVAVSAPGMANVISGNGSLLSVGAVFIYMGSDTGLAVLPAHTLQPTATIAGGLFGFSVAAGDVTGDGRPDVVVGAPIQRVSLNFGLGNVFGQIGSVFMYNAVNIVGEFPATFTQLNLTTSDITAASFALNSALGFSVAVTGDMNGDGKGEIIAGAPLYARLSGLAQVRTGAAFVFLSNAGNTFTSRVALAPPTGGVLGLSATVEALVVPLLGQTVWNTAALVLDPLLNGQIAGLLFGYSVEGAGPFTNDAIPDVVVSAPAGINLAILSGGLGLIPDVVNILSGQVLGGSAYVFAGTGTAAGVSTAISARLQANPAGLLSAAANLFGYSLRGVRNAAGARNGNILVGAPTANVLSDAVAGLQVKSGTVTVFAKQTTNTIPTPVPVLQTIPSPRQDVLLGLLGPQVLSVSAMFGASMDNLNDINCDTYPDIIIGEPLSTRVPLLGADVVGGAAHILFGRPNGTYQPTPVRWTLTTTTSALLGLNATGLLGFSVAGAGRTNGPTQPIRAIVGGPANALDFSSGLLNLGNTLSTLLGFAADANGLGKAYAFNTASLCGVTLPATLLTFTGNKDGTRVALDWVTVDEQNLSHYEVERSTDGITFTRIGELTAKEQQRNNYKHWDDTPLFGNNYYRLRVVDKDLKYVYSNTVAVQFNQRNAGVVNVAPNPARQQVNIRLTGFEKGEYTLRLFNTAGILFETRKVNLREHQQTEVMNRSRNIVPGVYFVTLHDENNHKLSTVRLIFNEQ